MTQLIFIHGSGLTSDIFCAQASAFSGSLAPALPGHGIPGSASSIPEFADFVQARMEQTPARAILVGHSLGGAVALEITLRRPPQLAGVVLVGSGARLRVVPHLLEGLRECFETTALEIAGLFFADRSSRYVRDAYTMMCTVGQAQTLLDFEACNAFDVSTRLAEISIPLLAIAGSADVLTPPKYARFVAERVAGGKERVIEGAGHMVMLERPAELNAALAGFVEELEEPDRQPAS